MVSVATPYDVYLEREARRANLNAFADDVYLTTRQKEALILLSQGETMKSAACKMGIKLTTVKNYLLDARGKCGAAHNMHLMAKVLRAKVIK